MEAAARATQRLRTEVDGGVEDLHASDVAGLPLPPRGVKPSTLPPLERPTSTQASVLTEIQERTPVQPSAAAGASLSQRTSFPVAFSVHDSAGIGAAAAASQAARGATGRGSSAVGGASRGSLFKQRLAGAGVSLDSPAAAAAAAGQLPAAAAAASTAGAPAPRPTSLLPSTASSRLALAQALGFSSVQELDDMDRQAEATVAAMSAAELEDSVAEARAALGEAAFSSMLSRQGSSSSSRGAAAAHKPSVAAAAAAAVAAPKPPPIDMSAITTHEELLQAAATYLPPSELRKLEWMGVLTPAASAAATAAAAAPATQQPSTHTHVRLELKGLEGSGQGRGDFGSGTAQGVALWSAATEDEELARLQAEGEEDESRGGGAVQWNADGSASRPAPHASSWHALTTDTAASQLSQLMDMVTGSSSGSASSSSSTAAASATTPSPGRTVAMAIDPPIHTLRFDLEGHLVHPPSAAAAAAAAACGGDALAPLLHHGTDPTHPGYTLLETLGLLRSSVEGQRRLALSMLAGILQRRRAAFVCPAAAAPAAAAAATGAAATSTAAPWRYPSQLWAEESHHYRSLLLPPILPVLLRLAVDEGAAATLEPALEALLALVGGGVGEGEGEHAPTATPTGTFPECAHFVSLLGSQAAAAEELHQWGQRQPPPQRPQPPVAHEGDWQRGEDSSTLLPGWLWEEGGGEGGTAAAAAPAARTAGGALGDGAAALAFPALTLTGRMGLLPRLGYIVGAWYVGKGGLVGSGGGGSGVLAVAVKALRALVLLAGSSSSSAALAPLTVAVTLPPSSVAHTLHLLPWCAHAYLFEHAALLRGGAAAAAAAAAAPSAAASPSKPVLRLSALSALLTLDLIHASVCSSRECARELCDSDRGLGGGGSRAAAPRPPWCSALTLDALLQFLPLSGAAKGLLELGAAQLAILAAGGGGGDAATAAAPLDTLDTLSLACAWRTLCILRACMAYGCGLDRFAVLWPMLQQLAAAAPGMHAAAATVAQSATPLPPAAAAARLFALGVLHCVGAFVGAAARESSQHSPLLPQGAQAQAAAAAAARVRAAAGLGGLGGMEGEGGEGSDEDEDEEEGGGQSGREGDAISLGNQASTMLQQCSFALPPHAAPFCPLLATQQLSILAAYFFPFPRPPAEARAQQQQQQQHPPSTPGATPTPLTYFPPPRLLDASPATTAAVAHALITTVLTPHLHSYSLSPTPCTPLTPSQALHLCACFRLLTAILHRAPAALQPLLPTLSTLLPALLPALAAQAQAPLYPSHLPTPLLDATAAARAYTCQPGLFTQRARPYLHAAASALLLAHACGSQLPLPLPLPLRLSTVQLALQVGAPGDEALCTALMRQQLFSAPSGLQGGELQAFLAAAAVLAPVLTEGVMGGDGSGAGAGAGVGAGSAARLHALLPGLLPPASLRGTLSLRDLCPRAAPPLSLNPATPASASASGTASDSPPPTLSTSLALLLPLLPRPLRPRTGLPLAYPSPSAAPASALLATCLALDLAYSGAVDRLVGERARKALEEARGGGRGGSSATYLLQHFCALLQGLGGSAHDTACALAGVSSSSSASGSGSASASASGAITSSSTTTPSAHLHASLSASLHALFLLLHCGLMPAATSPPPRAPLPPILLALNAHCTALAATLAPPGTPLRFSPPALLAAHSRCGGGGTLAALAGALGEGLGSEGPQAGACEGCAGVGLLVLGQRPLVRGGGAGAAAGGVEEEVLTRQYHGILGLLLEREGEANSAPSGAAAAAAAADSAATHAAASGHPCAPSLSALSEHFSAGYSSSSGSGAAAGPLALLAGALLPPCLPLGHDHPSCTASLGITTAESALASAAVGMLTSAAVSAAAEEEGGGGGGLLLTLLLQWPLAALRLLPAAALAASGRLAALPSDLQEAAEAALLHTGSGGQQQQQQQQQQEGISAYALACATVAGFLWSSQGQFWLGAAASPGAAALRLDFTRQCLARELAARAHPAVFSHVLRLCAQQQ